MAKYRARWAVVNKNTTKHNNMKVTNEIRIYRIDGKDTTSGEKLTLVVTSAWNASNLVELQLGEGGKVAVRASDLIKAIANSTNNDD